MNKPKYIIQIHGNNIKKDEPLYVFSYSLEGDRLATTTNPYEAKIFRSDDEVQGVIDELMTLSRTTKNNWVFSYDVKPV